MPEFSRDVTFSGRGTNRNWYTNLPMFASPEYVFFREDFNRVGLDSTNDWTVVKDAGAAVSVVADTAGGELVLTSTATTDNDGASIQGNEVFLPSSTKDIWFASRIKLADADQQDVFIGLCQNFTTNPEDVLTVSNRIGFQINDENASILCKTEAADTETSTDSLIDAVDATYVDLRFRVDGTANVYFYVNNALVATHSTNIPATELAPAVMSLSGNATGTKSLTCDYISILADR